MSKAIRPSPEPSFVLFELSLMAAVVRLAARLGEHALVRPGEYGNRSAIHADMLIR
jgi:hypothetical protein